MKHLTNYLLALLCLIFYFNMYGQTIDLSPGTYKKVGNQLNGFNPARPWAYIVNSNDKKGYGGLIDSDAISQFNDLSINVFRFPGGGTSNNYHRWRKGYGDREDEGAISSILDPATVNDGYDLFKDRYATNPESIYSGYSGWKADNPDANQNIIYPFMKYIKDLNADKNGDSKPDNNIKVIYVLNTLPHFSFVNDLRYELFDHVAEIEQISTLSDLDALKNNGILSQTFYDLVLENLDAINDLNNEVGVVGVEIGNELGLNKFQTIVDFNAFTKKATTVTDRLALYQKVYSSQDSNTIRFYAALVKMYSSIIKSSIINGSNIKIGSPLLPEMRYNNNWNLYLNNNCGPFLDAYITHNYFMEYDPKSLNLNVDDDCRLLSDTMNYYFNGLLTEFLGLKQSIFGNKKIWLTEFELKMDDNVNPLDPTGVNRRKFGNTLSQAFYNMQFYLTLLDVNNISTDETYIEYCAHQLLTDSKLGEDNNAYPTYELSNISYDDNPTPDLKRATYFANKLMTPLFKDDIYVVNNSSNLVNSTRNLTTKLYYKPGTGAVGDGGTLYLYYINNGESNVVSNLGNLKSKSGDPLSISSIKHSYMYADKLSASRGITSFLNDETIYANDLNTTIQVKDQLSLSNLNNFNYRKLSAGYLEIKLTEVPTAGNENTCSYIHLENHGGQGDFVNLPNVVNQNLSKSNFSIEMKVRGLVNTNYMVLISNAPQIYYPFSNNLTLVYNRYGGFNRLELWINGKKSAFNTCSNLNDDNWHHIALVRDNLRLLVYIDGNLCKSSAYSKSNEKGTVASSWSIGGGNKFKIKGTSAVGNYYGTTGDMDEVRIWNRALSIFEINLNKDQEIPQNSGGLVGYWNFNQGTQLIDDLSSTNNNGFLGLDNKVSSDDPTYKTDGCTNVVLANRNSINEDVNKEKVNQYAENRLNIFPNPSSGKPNVELFYQQDADAFLRVFNVQGQVLVNESIKLISGKNELTSLMPLLNKGMYFISIETQNGEKYQSKAIVF